MREVKTLKEFREYLINESQINETQISIDPPPNPIPKFYEFAEKFKNKTFKKFLDESIKNAQLGTNKHKGKTFDIKCYLAAKQANEVFGKEVVIGFYYDINKWLKNFKLPPLYMHAFNIDSNDDVLDFKKNNIPNSNMGYLYVKLNPKELSEYLAITNPRDYVKFTKNLVGLPM